MQSLAIVGTGIAGMGCVYFLKDRYDIALFEQNDYAGGHTNTVTIDEDGKPIHIDTGFMVYNESTYPNLTRLFRELNVRTMPAPMSFSVQHLPSGLEFCGSGLKGLFAQRKSLLNPAHYRFLWQIHKFNEEASEVLEGDRYRRHTLAQYVREKGYGTKFLHQYLLPMSSAVWSTPPDAMLEFPAATLVQFFSNHGFLGLNTQLQWRTVAGGSRSYRDKLLAPVEIRLQVRCPVRRVIREDHGATIVLGDGTSKHFDLVVLACHADQALALLDSPTFAERQHLAEFTYQKNIATLHTDAGVMPRNRATWSSWNYRIGADASGRLAPSTIYYMNMLQAVSEKRDYFVSINDPGVIDPAAILKQIEYEHPVFNLAATDAQHHLWSLNIGGPVYFCGSYFKYGFHEDALTSALTLSRRLTGTGIWT